MIAAPGVLAVQLTTADIAMAVAIFVLILISILTAAAETALVRISRAKASALAEEGRPGGAALVYLVEQPERWLNALLLEDDRVGFVRADPDRQISITDGFAQQQHRLIRRLLHPDSDDVNLGH